MSSNWWDAPYVAEGTKTLTFQNGQPDYEKGDVFSLPAGTPIALPVAGKVAWAGKYQEVVQLATGQVLNLLHIDPTVQAGQATQAGQVVGDVTAASGYYTDPATGHWYQSTGNVLEAGVYDTVQRAIARDNPSPTDFTGISNPTSLFRSWDTGHPATVSPASSGNTSGNATSWTNPFAYGWLSPFYWGTANGPAGEPGIVPTPSGGIGFNPPSMNPAAWLGFGQASPPSWLDKLVLVAGLCIAGFLLIYLAFKKQAFAYSSRAAAA